MRMKSEPNNSTIIATRVFSLDDQSNFATFSGDFNPIHVDGVFARRTQFGRCVVHGMHSLLWALDALLETQGIYASSIKARFLKPIFLDDAVDCVWDANAHKVTLQTDGLTLATLSLESRTLPICYSLVEIQQGALAAPLSLTFEQCASQLPQELLIQGTPDLAARLFPKFCSLYGVATAVDFGAASYLVGMRCPGLHSLFTGITVSLNRPSAAMGFQISSTDLRFGLVDMHFQGLTLAGEIQTMYRPTPITNPPTSHMAQFVSTKEFMGVRALVLGGSRGLGEIATKLLIAGGANVSFTYHQGLSDAQAISHDIAEFGGSCQYFQLSANSDSFRDFDFSEFDHVYYFPTPKILGKRTRNFDATQEREYQAIYIDAFRSLCQNIVDHNLKVSIFYPSSSYVDQPPKGLESYAAAKLQAQSVAKGFNKRAGLQVITTRLPQLATDQNQGLLTENYLAIVDCLLPCLRELHAAHCSN